MFSTSFVFESSKTTKTPPAYCNSENIMDFNYNLLYPTASSIDINLESIKSINYKGFKLSVNDNTASENASSSYFEEEQLLENNTRTHDEQNTDLYKGEHSAQSNSLSYYDPLHYNIMNNGSFSNPVCEAFICGGLDPRMAPQMNYNFFKDNFPSSIELPSSIVSGYNCDLDLTSGFDGQQYFNSGATTSSLMCCTAQNIVSPEKSTSLLPELVSPDEFNSSDEDNTSAVDEQDFLFSKRKPSIEGGLIGTNANKNAILTESTYRQVEHKNKKHQQTEECKYLKKINEKPEGLCKDKTYNKKTRKNYEKNVINKLMSCYLTHNGRVPDGSTKSKICKDTGKSLVQVSTWFQNAKRRYSHKLEIYNSYSQQYPDLVYDSESLEAFMRSEKI